MSPEPNKYYGKYRGTVVNNIDPLGVGRLLCEVPDVLSLAPSSWAVPCVPLAGPTGTPMGAYLVPPIGAGVWIEFEHGDPDYPIFAGCWWGSPADPPSEVLVPPYQKVMIKSIGGNSITLDDTPGIGGVTIQTSTGQKITLTALGIEIDDGQGGAIKMLGPQVSINNGALDVI